MTIAQLEALLQQHLPECAARPAQQGRAGVTPAGVTLVTTGAPTVTHYRWESRRPCACGCGRTVYGRFRVYFSNACKQKAYRQRKKGKRAA